MEQGIETLIRREGEWYTCHQFRIDNRENGKQLVMTPELSVSEPVPAVVVKFISKKIKELLLFSLTIFKVYNQQIKATLIAKRQRIIVFSTYPSAQ